MLLERLYACWKVVYLSKFNEVFVWQSKIIKLWKLWLWSQRLIKNYYQFYLQLPEELSGIITEDSGINSVNQKPENPPNNC